MYKCKFQVGETYTVISGDYHLETVRQATSYFIEGYQFTDKFKEGWWDGRKHLFVKSTRSFPTGILPDVKAALEEAYIKEGIEFEEEWCGGPFPVPKGGEFKLHGIEFGVGKYDYQLEACATMLEKKRGILKISTGGGKTAVAAALTKYIGRPTLFLVQRKELLYQTRAAFANFFGIDESSIGVIGDSQCEVREITIASPISFLNRLKEGLVTDKWDVLFCDEVHEVAADEYYDATMSVRSHYRFGLSATPMDRTDGASLRVKAAVGPIIYEVRNKTLMDRGVIAKTEIKMVPIEHPKILRSTAFTKVEKVGIRENVVHNNQVIKQALYYAREGKQVLVLVDKTEHGKTLFEALRREDRWFKTVFIHGKETMKTRKLALQQFKAKMISILIATSILDQGVDVPNIDVLVLAAGGKAKIRLLQRLGRGLRLAAGKDKLIVVDFVNYCHPYLTKHSLARLNLYKAEDCFVITSEKL